MNDEKKIYEVLVTHHEYVRNELKYRPIMTVLVGSQNYDLATENSDYDTFTFVVPTLRSVSVLDDPVSKTIDYEDGHINVKDIRLALNLLKKTNPNSVECFATDYYIVEPEYQWIIHRVQDPAMFRCDTKCMVNAIRGMAKQLSKRNMAPGKRFSHILRMECMLKRYFSPEKPILRMDHVEHEMAMDAKRDPENPVWEECCVYHAQQIDRLIESLDVDTFKDWEGYIREVIDNAMIDIMTIALKEEV